ncbi:MAG TPA: hypothetical protein VFW71_15435 [Actinomycetota bacterium]|nr:hypothetical protein [Actinomycetota bacterium]
MPSVEGAITRCPSTEAVEAQRSTSASSIESPPASIECTRVSTLRPGRAAPGRSPSSTVACTSSSMPRCWAKVAGRTSPALATAWSSSKITDARSRLWEDVT